MCAHSFTLQCFCRTVYTHKFAYLTRITCFDCHYSPDLKRSASKRNLTGKNNVMCAVNPVCFNVDLHFTGWASQISGPSNFWATRFLFLVFPYFSFLGGALDEAGHHVSFWAHVNLSYRIVTQDEHCVCVLHSPVALITLITWPSDDTCSLDHLDQAWFADVVMSAHRLRN